MKRQLSARVDLRGFRWRLEPLRTKLHAELDAARYALASLVREEQERADAVRLLDAQFLHDAKTVLSSPLEPQGRARSLAYLVARRQELEGCRREAAALRSRVTAAREGCMTVERRLESVEKLRGNAQASFAQEQVRSAAKHADLAWLASRWRSAHLQDGSAP
jgi:hypothetical protein